MQRCGCWGEGEISSANGLTDGLLKSRRQGPWAGVESGLFLQRDSRGRTESGQEAVQCW